MQKYTIKTTADERADTIVHFPIRGNLGLINFPNVLRRYDAPFSGLSEFSASVVQ